MPPFYGVSKNVILRRLHVMYGVGSREILSILRVHEKKKKIPLLVTIIIYFRYVFFKAFRGHRKCVGTVRNVHNKSA